MATETVALLELGLGGGEEFVLFFPLGGGAAGEVGFAPALAAGEGGEFLDEGGNVTLTSGTFVIQDEDTARVNISVVIIDGPMQGDIVRLPNMTPINGSFTLEDLDSGLVGYKHYTQCRVILAKSRGSSTCIFEITVSR